MPQVSIVIVTWNSADVVVECLRSLRDNPPSSAYETIVVDNGSVDRTVDLIHEHAPWVRVIANSENRGLAAANNQGLVAAKGEIILISNPDVLITPRAIDELGSLLERRPRAAVAVPQLIQENGDFQVSAGSLPGFWEAFLGSARRLVGVESDYWWYSWPHDREALVGHGADACYAVRRAAIADAGPLDERYRLDWEGIEWSARLQRAGWECWFCPSARIVHLGGTSIRQVPFRWIIQSHAGMYRYFRDALPPRVRPLLPVLIIGRAFAKLAIQAVRGRMYEGAHRGARLAND